MGKRGPAPTPTPILAARGSWRGKVNKGEPKPAAVDPDPPAWLTESARAVWDQMLDQLRPTGVLTRVDGNALGRYCDVMVHWQRAAAFIAKNGDSYPIKDAKGQVKCLMQFPQMATYHKLAAAMLRLEQEFGLTPSSRSRITLPSPSDDNAAPDKSAFFPRAAG